MSNNNILGLSNIGLRILRRPCVALILAVVLSIYFVEYFLLTADSDWNHWQAHLKSLKATTNNVTSTTKTPNEYYHYEAQLQAPFSENASLAEFLYNEVRVLCWIPILSAGHLRLGKAIKNTWGKRCHKLIFMSSEADADLGAIHIPTPDGYSHLWEKTKMSLLYIYTHHLNDADWFYKADDNTYAIMENLRYFLYPYHPDTPIYFGFKFKDDKVEKGYMSGGSGYVLSREALIRFIEIALPNATICRPTYRGAEDKEIGRCLANVNVEAGDTRDIYGRFTFIPLAPDDVVVANFTSQTHWLYKYSFYNFPRDADCCSNYAVSFHYVTPNVMYGYEFLLYSNRPFGIQYGADLLPKKLAVGDIKSPWLQRNTNNSNITNGVY